MKKYEIIVGIDVSKKKLDVTIVNVSAPKEYDYFMVENTTKGFKELLKKLTLETLFCFEYTGNYGAPLCLFLQENTQDYWQCNPLVIKRSKGIARGKSDKADSKDIAFFALSNLHKVELSKLPEVDIQTIKNLLTERDKLNKAIMIFSSTKEYTDLLQKNTVKEVVKNNNKTVNFLKKQIKEIEKSIKEVVKLNEVISEKMDLAMSVPGVGEQTALQLIVRTRCFTAFKDSRKLACYMGIAPFPYSSGSSIKGKTKVSHYANKKLKSILSMAALSAKKWDYELASYYTNKTEEGKAHSLIMNNIKNKIIARVYAVVQRGTPFVNTRKFSVN